MTYAGVILFFTGLFFMILLMLWINNVYNEDDK